MDGATRIQTDVPQLDTIMGGGIVQGSLVLITGTSGTGKTVLAAQIASAAADRNERVLFTTAFSEPHNKLIANLRALQFFQQQHLGDQIKLVNLQHPLLNGLSEAADTLVREAREHRAQIVVLDGLQGVLMAGNNPLLPHQFLFDLSARLSLLNVTTIITHDLAASNEILQSDLTAVDDVIVLSQDLLGQQAIRMLQVIKQRGSSPLLGRHSFRITDTGIVCYPRQESITAATSGEPRAQRSAFGIAKLDTILDGGLNQGTTTMIMGAEGVGKTLLSLHFCREAVQAQESVLVVSFYETPQQLVAKGRSFGFDLQQPIDDGRLLIQHYLPVEVNPDMVAHHVREAIIAHNVQRLVIDGINEIERPLIERGRARDFFAALIAFLESHNVTTCMTRSLATNAEERLVVDEHIAALFDNILLLRHHEGDKYRYLNATNTITVLKMRFSRHDRHARPYTIDENGINVA